MFNYTVLLHASSTILSNILIDHHLPVIFCCSNVSTISTDPNRKAVRHSGDSTTTTAPRDPEVGSSSSPLTQRQHDNRDGQSPGPQHGHSHASRDRHADGGSAATSPQTAASNRPSLRSPLRESSSGDVDATSMCSGYFEDGRAEGGCVLGTWHART